MNVLILTPDAVGSTLLQRMLTIYMQFHNFDQPVINLHELTNSLEKYYSPEFNREIVSKKAVKNWGYHQSLQEIVELLSSVDHYKTSRLAHYHIRNRNDSIEQQVPFYKYLNENFYIISCRRANVFEHALSMTLNKITKKLNVYDAYEKIDTFYEMYQSGVTLDPAVFINQLDLYHLYVQWSEQHFDIGSYFNYEQDVPRLEEYILNLPVFSGQPELVTWKNNFGLSFENWNKMHYACSDISSIAMGARTEIDQLLLSNVNDDVVSTYQQNAPESAPAINSLEDFNNLPENIKRQFYQIQFRKEGIFSLLPTERQQQLSQYQLGYAQAQQTISQMVNLGIIISGPPIKKQTLSEKRKIIKNFDVLIDLYNKWAINHPTIASPVTDLGLLDLIQTESQFWNPLPESVGLQNLILPNG
jgi:hypothetical protein